MPLWERLGYVFACLTVPVAWGIFVVWASNRIERRVRRRAEARRKRGDAATAPEELPPLEYHI